VAHRQPALFAQMLETVVNVAAPLRRCSPCANPRSGDDNHPYGNANGYSPPSWKAR